MWTTVLVLGLAVNLEPTRIAIIALMLAGRRPAGRLLLFVASGMAVTAAAGVLVLFVFQRVPVLSVDVKPAAIQIAIGVLALVGAGVLALRAPLEARVGVSARVAAVVAGESRWLPGLAGAGMGLPSVEFLALLALIVASGEPPAVQGAALATFIVLANLVALAPLVGHALAPEPTTRAATALSEWARSRSRRQVALFVAAVGLVLVIAGVLTLR